MGDDHVVVFYDETSPLEQSRRSILQYRPSPQPEAATYLVELPEKQIDAPRPSTRPARRSTIVNTFQLPDTREAEDQPLEEYVRRNLPSFRKSLTPESLQHLQERYVEGEVVRPATAEDIQRDMMDSTKRKNRSTESEKRETIPKYRDTYQSESFLEPKSQKIKQPNQFEDSHSYNVEKKKKKFDQDYHDLHHPRNEVVVMPALEPVSVSHKSPFHKDLKYSPPNNRLFSPVKVKVSIESEEDEKQRGKYRPKNGKSEPASAKRRSSKESNEDSVDEDEDRNKKRHKKHKRRQKSETPTYDSVEPKDQYEKSHRRSKRKEKSEEAKRGRNESRESSRSSDDEYRKRKHVGKVIRTRSSSVCLSGQSEGDTSEPYIVNNPQNRYKRASNKSPNKSRPSSTKDKPTGETSSKRLPQSAAKRERNTEDKVGYNQTKNPFGKQDPYSVHFVATKKGAAKKNPEKKKPDNDEKTGGEDPNKKTMAKAPRSATKVVAMRRYHIQIPEHGRPETWFNVRFNMNAQNQVDMNYDGPVKINNYYASNNYT